MIIDIEDIIIILVCIIVCIIIMIFINRDKFSLNCKKKEITIDYNEANKNFDDNIKLIIDTNKTQDNDLL